MLKQYFPILQWLLNYKKSNFSGDISAGITVGIMLIPQGMAYAMIAGLPPVFGLYAALIPQIVYAIMGTSRQLAVGPVAMDSLLVASGLGALAVSGIKEYIAMAVFLSLLMGAIQLLFGFFRMGFLVNFLSKPVISGFTSAAAVIIGLSQLKHLLGVTIEQSNQVHVLLLNVFKAIDKTNFYTLTLGICAIILIKSVKKIHPNIPAPLVVVILGTISAYLFKINELGVKIVEEIPKGLPSIEIPMVDYSRVSELIPIAITLALIAFMEAISVAKAIEEKHSDYVIDSNQELIALGTANIIGSFFQSYPTTGGFSRTAVNDQAGAKTGISSLVSALIVGVTLLFLTPLFYYLPNTVLAAIIMVAVFGLIDFKYPIQLIKNRKDEFIILIITFIITLVIGITEGILLGILISLLVLLYRTSIPHMAVLGHIKNTPHFKNITRFPDIVQIQDNILMLRFDAQLYFGNKDFFKRELYKQIKYKGDKLDTIILDAGPISFIDSSAVFVLQKIIQDLKDKNIKFLLAGAIGPTRDIIFNSSLSNCIEVKHLFVSVHNAYQSCISSFEKTVIQEKIVSQSKTFE